MLDQVKNDIETNIIINHTKTQTQSNAKIITLISIRKFIQSTILISIIAKIISQIAAVIILDARSLKSRFFGSNICESSFHSSIIIQILLYQPKNTCITQKTNAIIEKSSKKSLKTNHQIVLNFKKNMYHKNTNIKSFTIINQTCKKKLSLYSISERRFSFQRYSNVFINYLLIFSSFLRRQESVNKLFIIKFHHTNHST